MTDETFDYIYLLPNVVLAATKNRSINSLKFKIFISYFKNFKVNKDIFLIG